LYVVEKFQNIKYNLFDVYSRVYSSGNTKFAFAIKVIYIKQKTFVILTHFRA